MGDFDNAVDLISRNRRVAIALLLRRFCGSFIAVSFPELGQDRAVPAARDFARRAAIYFAPALSGVANTEFF